MELETRPGQQRASGRGTAADGLGHLHPVEAVGRQQQGRPAVPFERAERDVDGIRLVERWRPGWTRLARRHWPGRRAKAQPGSPVRPPRRGHSRSRDGARPGRFAAADPRRSRRSGGRMPRGRGPRRPGGRVGREARTRTARAGGGRRGRRRDRRAWQTTAAETRSCRRRHARRAPTRPRQIGPACVGHRARSSEALIVFCPRPYSRPVGRDWTRDACRRSMLRRQRNAACADDALGPRPRTAQSDPVSTTSWSSSRSTLAATVRQTSGSKPLRASNA